MQPPTNGHSGSDPFNSKFQSQDVGLLKQLLITEEKHKWKLIAKEINQRNKDSDQSTGSSSIEPEDDPLSLLNPNPGTKKTVSPTYVQRQYHSMLGLPKNSVYFGVLGSSLPYVVAEKGWDDIEEPGIPED